MKNEDDGKMSKKRKKWNYQEVYDYFIDNRCLLLSKEFIKQKDTLDYICECGRPSTINFDNFKKGNRCKECKKVKCGKAKRLTYEEVKGRFEENGCILLSKTYINNTEPLDYICICGEPNKISLMSISVGKLCFDCGEIKRIQTTINNGTAPTSSQQIHISELINATLNFPVNTSFLDMVLPEDKTYIEYDGSGHWMRVKFGIMTEKEFADNERARTYALLRRGWKEIRIISRKDKLPSDEIIKEIINYAKSYLDSGHHWIHFDIDNGKAMSSQFNIGYDFGEISKLNSKKRKFKEVS